MEQIRGFDFLLANDWTIENRALQGRLQGSTQWEKFEARLIDARKILAGLGNVDRFISTRNGEVFEAVSLRLFNPETDEWTIYWADSRSVRLTEQVRGRFREDGVGEFFGEEIHRGETKRLRFLWSDISEHGARWEQAYFDEQAEEWETNWVMTFRPVGSVPR